MKKLELTGTNWGYLPKGIYLKKELLLTEDISHLHLLIDKPILMNNHFTVILVMDGEMELVYESKIITGKKGCLMVLMKGVLMKLLKMSQNLRLKMLFLNAEFCENLRNLDYVSVAIQLRTYPVICFKEEEQTLFLKYLSTFESALTLESTKKETVAVEMLRTLYHVATQFDEFKLGKDKQVTRDRQIFDSFLSLFEKHYHESYEVAYYADKLCITTNYLSKIAIRLTKKSIKKWMHQLLMERACGLFQTLQSPSVKEVGELLGFQNQSSFCRSFKKYKGISPRQYILLC